MCRLLVLASLCAAAGACASTAPTLAAGDLPGITAAPSQASASVEARATLRPEAAPRQQPAAGTTDPLGEAFALSVWQDPAFKRSILASYRLKSDVEPSLTEDELETMLAIVELIAEEKLEQAEQRLQKSRSQTAPATFDFSLANLHFQRGELDDAVRYAEIAVDKFPNYLRAWQLLGQCAVQQENYRLAVRALARSIQLGEANGVIYGALGFAYYNLRDFISAESAFRMAIILDADRFQWKEGLVFALFEQGRYPTVAAYCESLLEQQPESDKLWMMQANAFLRMEQPLKAIENFEFVDSMGLSSPTGLANLGDLYALQQMPEMAVDAHRRAFELEPVEAVDRTVRAAKALTANAAYAQSEQLIALVESGYPGQLAVNLQKDLQKLRAHIAVARDSSEGEAEALEAIVALDPLDGQALILLGRNRQAAGDVEVAIARYEQAAMIEEFEAEAKRRHAELLVREERYEEALPLLRRVQALDPRPGLDEFIDEVERLADRSPVGRAN